MARTITLDGTEIEVRPIRHKDYVRLLRDDLVITDKTPTETPADQAKVFDIMDAWVEAAGLKDLADDLPQPEFQALFEAVMAETLPTPDETGNS